MQDKSSRGIISLIVEESNFYTSIADLERISMSSEELALVPLQPLYLVLKNAAAEQVAEFLPKLQKQQREVLLDIDLWQKDRIDITPYLNWMKIYDSCPDQRIRKEFVETDGFLLFLKARFNIWSFDYEEPNYPDHDNYFITDDNSFIFEHDSELDEVDLIREMVRRFYAQLGVTPAYNKLLSVIGDTYTTFEEHCYQRKKERLREYGFVDYFESVSMVKGLFTTTRLVNNYINRKDKITPELSSLAKSQSLHSSSLVAFYDSVDELEEELQKVSSSKRRDFLHFNFIRVVNANLSFTDSLREGRVAMTRTGTQMVGALKLGLSYIQNSSVNESIFDVYDFQDLFRVGRSLVEINQRKIKLSVDASCFDEDLEYFLGLHFNNFLDRSFSSTPEFLDKGDHKVSPVTSAKALSLWERETELFLQSIPYVEAFYKALNDLKDREQISDSYFINYKLDDIDFESVLMSSFIHFALGNYDGDTKRMGVSVDEFNKFVELFFIKSGQEYILKTIDDESMGQAILEYLKRFGFTDIPGFDFYLFEVLDEHLTGYEYDKLASEDYAHVGGPILLA